MSTDMSWHPEPAPRTTRQSSTGSFCADKRARWNTDDGSAVSDGRLPYEPHDWCDGMIARAIGAAQFGVQHIARMLHHEPCSGLGVRPGPENVLVPCECRTVAQEALQVLTAHVVSLKNDQMDGRPRNT